MAVEDINFTTGPAMVPDVGNLSYNGCTFSPLFATSVSGNPIKDRANRTVKCMEYELTVDGYATLPAGESSVDGVMSNLRELLTAQAGDLKYDGRGFDLDVNGKSGDVAWGPVPELLEFQPLGAGRSAKVQWKVTVRITEPSFSILRRGENKIRPLLQFNYETSVTYNEDGYSSLSMRGTMEIPMTRPNQKTRTLDLTVDHYRGRIGTRLMSGIDLSKFRITRREFNVSRDKRTLEWDFVAEEMPYMNMPQECTIARGTYSVRPAKAGMGLASWLCTLRATYTVRNDKPRRIAWLAFLALLRLRMKAAEEGEGDPGGKVPFRKRLGIDFIIGNPVTAIINAIKEAIKEEKLSKQRAWLIDFTFDEGLYLDSKTTSFSATWRINNTIDRILLASGIWTKLPEKDKKGDNLWALSMRDVSGVRSWEPNILDPTLDVIVDFGGG